MSLREAKKQATAREIETAARSLFLSQGYEATTMEQVAEAAGVSRASLFNYYGGKPALLEALAAQLQSRLVRLLQHYRDKSNTTSDCIEQVFAYSARVLEQTSALTRLLFIHGSAGDGFPGLQDAFTDLVIAGQRRGEVRTDFSAAELAEPLYLGFIAGLLGWCHRPETGLDEQFAARARLLALQLQG